MLALMCMVPLDAQARGPVALRCDALEHPLGDDNPIPLFSWQLLDGRRGARQSSYKILVATDLRLLVDGRADLWDSGRQSSDRSVDVPYTGAALHPETRYYWRVEVWDKDEKPYPLSESSWWETGLMGQEHWSGRWIG
jgi:alpha-L-rhamnosidase